MNLYGGKGVFLVFQQTDDLGDPQSLINTFLTERKVMNEDQVRDLK